MRAPWYCAHITCVHGFAVVIAPYMSQALPIEMFAPGLLEPAGWTSRPGPALLIREQRSLAQRTHSGTMQRAARAGSDAREYRSRRLLTQAVGVSERFILELPALASLMTNLLRMLGLCANKKEARHNEESFDES